MTAPRIYVAMRRDLNMRRGKEVAQACHAVLALGAPDVGPIVGIRAEGLAHLSAMVMEAEAAGIRCHVVTDAGLTEFTGPTITCAAFGPVLPGQVALLSDARLY